MRIKVFIIPIILFFILIIIPNFLLFISDLVFSKGNNFVVADYINENLEKFFPNSNVLKIKKGDFYYRIGKYEKALSFYNSSMCNSKNMCFTLEHNSGNTYYRLGESNEVKEEKIFYYESALSSYLEALKNKYDKETKSNYDFVLDKLNELTKEERQKEMAQEKEKQKQEEKQKEQERKKQEEEKKKIEEQNGQEQNGQEQIIPKGNSIKIDEFAKNAKTPLTDSEKKELEKYLELLKQEEKDNINLNKLNDNGDIFDILENNFSGIEGAENDR